MCFVCLQGAYHQLTFKQQIDATINEINNLAQSSSLEMRCLNTQKVRYNHDTLGSLALQIKQVGAQLTRDIFLEGGGTWI